MFLSTSSILAAWDLTGLRRRRPGVLTYHPSVLLKLYIYGYLNRVQSSRRLEREAGRNFAVLVATRIAGACELQLIAAQDDLVAPKRHFPAERIA